ncbi:RNA polymerase sigma factor [Kitasatospora griseola]|uniref:RNA polymerase sigma factor n=1 Tax=Kitasatospora griseola TaxID=2064 RepID=UPI003818D2B2
MVPAGNDSGTGFSSIEVAVPGRQLVFEAFCKTHEAAWKAFALARGLTAKQAAKATGELRTRLWQCWDDVLRRPVPAAEAWKLLKEEIATATATATPQAAPAPAWKKAIRAALHRMKINMGVWIDEYGTYEAILALPERQQETIIMRFMLELPDEVIAEYLDSTVPNVRSNISHGCSRLEQKLKRRSH